MAATFVLIFLFVITTVPALLAIALLVAVLKKINAEVPGEAKPQEPKPTTQGLNILDAVGSGRRFGPASSENGVWMRVSTRSGLIVEDGTNYPYAMSVPLLTCSYELDMTEKWEVK